MMQQVEESGHSNWLPGHWTAPTSLSADNRVQDSTNPVRKGHSPRRYYGNCRPNCRRSNNWSQGLGDHPGSQATLPTS